MKFIFTYKKKKEKNYLYDVVCLNFLEPGFIFHFRNQFLTMCNFISMYFFKLVMRRLV